MSMPHDISLILTLTGGLGAALVLGFVTQKLRLSPLVGYLLAGILVGVGGSLTAIRKFLRV